MMNLNKAEMETCLLALESYCQIEQNEDAGKMVTKIIKHLEQSEQQAQSFVSITVTGTTNLSPDEVVTEFNSLSISSELGLDFASIQDCEFTINAVELIDLDEEEES